MQKATPKGLLLNNDKQPNKASSLRGTDHPEPLKSKQNASPLLLQNKSSQIP